MNLNSALESFPGSKALVVLSGGMDSTIAARLAVEKLGKDDVQAISFFYGQKQSIELEFAKRNAHMLGIKHILIDISFLGDMVRNVSANVVGGKTMPTIKDILGDPAPPTEVPFRNGILLMNSAAYAQANGLDVIVTGVQSQDQYSYFDTTPAFIESVNNVIALNRKHKIQVYAPWQGISKTVELNILKAMDGNVNLTKSTITCYNPQGNISCGKCPSCSERIAAFKKAGLVDEIPYAININW